MRIAFAGLLLPAAFLVAGGGCTSPKQKGPETVVSGTVKLANGDPVTGNVIFVGADGKSSPPALIADGKYDIPNPPEGKVKILVKSMGMGVPMKEGPPMKDAPSMSGKPPPPKYGAINTTDLEYEVKPGKQTHDIVLK